MTEPPAAFKPFDFRSPCRLPMQVESRLIEWQRRACKLLPQKWGEHLGYSPEWSTASPETVNCQSTELPPHTVVFHIRLSGQEQPTLLAIPSELGVALVQSVLGVSVDKLETPRELTSIEVSMLVILAELGVNALNDGAKGAGYPLATLAQHESNPLMLGIFPTEEELVVLRFSLSGPFGESEIQWLWPESLAELLFKQDDLSEVNGKQSPQLQDLLLRAPFELTVELGRTQLRVAELASLTVGDVLVFNQRISEPLKCVVGDQVMMHAWPATTGKQQSIQIDRYE